MFIANSPTTYSYQLCSATQHREKGIFLALVTDGIPCSKQLAGAHAGAARATLQCSQELVNKPLLLIAVRRWDHPI
jgi:hypothetical protein